MRKRAFAWLLSFAMLLSFIPNAALANEPNSQNSILEVEQPEAENVSDAQDAQAKVAETAVAQDERRSAEAKTLPSTRDEPKYETPDATQSVIPEEDNDNAVTDVLEQNADAHLAEDALVQGLTPAFSDVQRGMLLGESVEIIASGECGANGSNVTWTLDANGVLTISGTGAMTDDNPYNKPWTASQIKELVIQSGVTSIGAGAFYCSSLTSVTIPDSVTSIGYMAFKNCRGLTSVTIPDSVTSIGSDAFSGCRALTDVTIPVGVTSIGNYTFDDCSGLTSVTIPNSVTSIGVGAFRDCRGLTSITIPEGVTSIGNEAFYDCRGLTNVTIPASVTIIGDHAFYACIALTNIQVHNENKAYKSVDGVLFNKSGSILLCYPVGRVEASYLIPDGVTSIEYDAFRFCRNLMDVTLPDSVTSIGDYAFEGCSGLTSVTVPEGVTSIGYMAFINCSGLTSVTIPDSVTSIGDSAFSGCSNLTDLYYIGSETQWNAITIGSNNAPLMSTSTTIHYWTGENWTCKEFGIIASGVCGANGDNVTWTLDTNGLLTISGSGAMADCGISVSSGGWNDYESAPWKDAGVEVRSVIVENGVTNFGAGTFSDCNQLESVAVPESVTDIGASAFRGCRSLTSFDIPSNVTNIGDWAFYCSGLTSVDIPVSVTSIGNYAFWNCVSLTSVTIPGNVISIGDFAFGACCLESVSILNGVTSIGDSSFASCTALTSVSIPDSVTNIGQSAFANCKNLTSVTIPNGVTQITRSAFHYCESLKSVNIPESVTEIKDWAFYGCSALTDIYYLGSEEQWNAITIGSNNAPLMSTSATIHYNWTGEESTSGIIASGECGADGDNITWTLNTDGLLTIRGTGAMANYSYPQYEPWLDKVSQIKEVVVESGVTTIGHYAFFNCTNLKRAIIPDGTIAIGKYAFWQCAALTDVTIPEGVTTIGADVFGECSALSSVTIPNSVTTIEYEAFKNCANLTSVTISNGVTTIEQLAFFGCGSLRSLTIPASVAIIRFNAFGRCTALTDIQVHSENQTYQSIDGVVFTKDSATLLDYPRGKSAESYTIPSGVITIEGYAFQNCSALTSVTIPDSVTDIARGAFDSCSALTDVYYLGSEAQWNAVTIGDSNDPLTSAAIHYNWTDAPEIIASGECGADGNNVTWTLNADGLLTISGAGAMADYADANLTPWADKKSQIKEVVIESGVTSIGERAFIWNALTSVSIPDSVTHVGAHAFYGSGLASVTIPKSVTSIGSYAFSYCSGLTSIQVHSENEAYKSVDGVLFNKEGAILLCYPRGKTETSYSIPNGVTNLGAFSFSACNALTSVTIPNSVTGIALGAFCECSGLTSVTIPDSVTTIAEFAFNVTALTDVHYLGSEAQWNAIRIGDSNAPLTSAAIHYNGGQPEIISSGECGADGGNVVWTLYSDGTLMLIGQGKIRDYAWSGANVSPWYYSSGSNVKNIIIGDGITRIGRSVFEGCKNLISVTIPVSVVSVGTAFFSSGLKTVYYTGSQAQFSKISIQNNLLGENDIFINAEKHYNTVPSSAPTPVIAHTIETISPVDASTIGGVSPVITVTMGGLFPFNLSVTAEKDGDITEIPVKNAMKTSGGKSVHTLTLDLSALNSGLYQFRFFNSDYGIEKNVFYDVDRSAPSKPENFRVMPGNLKNTLAWDTAKEADMTSIRVYRTTDEMAEPELLTALSGRATVTYTDNGLEDGVTYYYWLGFLDKFSQESEKAGPVAGTPTSDSEPPSIATVYPADGTTLTGSVNFRVTASDNQQVKSVAMEISTIVGDSASWETLETVETTGQVEFTVDSTRYNVDALYVRFLAEDASGNTAYSKLTYTFPVDNTPPEIVSSITGEASATSITLHWTYDAPSDFSHFTLEKRDGSETYAEVGGNLTSLGAQISNLTPGTEYSFRVMAFDIHGNHSEYSEEYSVTTSADTDAPVITAMSPKPGRYRGSIPLLFTAADNDGVQSVTYQTSNDGLEWTDATTITLSSGNKTVAVSYSLNTASFEEGILYVRAVASDASGNVSDTSNNAPYTQYMVDRTAPAAPRALEGVSVSGAVYLTWLQGTEQDLNGYTVERAYEENGSYSALATAWKKLSYTDSGVAAGQTYYYRLRSQDTAGNASDYGEVVAVTVETVPDTEAPRIVSVSPSDGYILGSNTPIRVSVSDNQLVATLSVQYSVDGENWNSLEEITVSATSGVVTLPLMASDIDGGALSLRVSCTDGAGLTSGTVNRAYSIDTTPPVVPVVTAEAAAMSVVLNWTSGNESDLAGFYIYRKAGGESEYSYFAQCGKNTTSYTDSKVIAERNYSYYVSAIDARSNQSSSAPTEAIEPLNIDVEPPVIRASGDTIGTVGIEMQFSAKNTTDNFGASGLSYSWNFGDGGTSALLEPRHTYQSAGSYTVSLTVTDTAGNSSSGQISITVKEATEAAWLDVTVKDDSGNPISGAGVYFDLGEEKQETVYTNDSGVARVTATEGTFTVGVYKNGYLPEKAENVTLIKGATASVTVQLVKKNIVTGRLTVERMTLEEIEAAGIDTADPANQQVFQYEITLTYGSEPVNIQTRVNGNGKILVDPEPITIKNSGGEKRVLQTFVFSGTDADVSNVHAPTWNGGANAPIVAVIDLPGEAIWLKDFFDVHLYVINQAAPDFVLDDCGAVLNVPDGLTLMDSNRTAATPDRNMGSIAGQRSASAEWIVRGDKGGDYTLSADFSATLREFNESVTARFETAEPFHVRQGDNLSLDIVVENAIISGADGAVRIGLRNDDTNPYYLPSMRIGHGASLIRSFKTNGRTAVSGNMNALNPGETIWWDYRIPREEWDDLSENSDKDFWLTDAVVNALGGNVTLNAFIRRVTPFTIDGDLIEVYKITPQGEERPISYINAQKSSNNVPIPDLLIRTYRLDEQQQYVPCSMEVTIQDEKRPSDVILMSKGVGSAVTDANGELLLPGYVWNPKYVTEGGIMEGGWVTEQEKSYTIRISSKRSMPVEIPVAIMETDEYGHLELHVYEKDGNSITALDDGINVKLTDGVKDYPVDGLKNEGSGQYDASNVPKGQLTISVEKEGYLPCTFDYTQEKMTVLRICLRKDDDPSQSQIVNISNTLSKNSYNYTIVPLNHIKAGESIVVRPFSRIADGDAFQTYRYRIVHEESVTESGDFAGELIFPLSAFQVGDSLEIALVTRNQGEGAYVDSGISFVNSPDIFKEFGEWFFDLAGIVNKDEISVPELFEMPKTEAKEVTGASFVGTGTFIPESTGQETKNLTGVISDYTVVGTEAKQKYPLSVQYDSSGKFTFSIIAGGEASITQSKERWAKTSGFSDPPPKDFSKDSSMFKVEQKSTSEKSWGIENSVRLDIIVQYEPSLNCWTADAKGSVDGGVEICLFKGALPLGPLTVVELFAKLDTEFGYAGTWSIGHMEFRENSEDTLFSNGLYPEELALNGTLNASAGAELISDKIASVSLYALAGLGIELAPDAKITGKFGLGTKENVLFWKAEQKWFEDEWEKPIHSSVSLQGAIDSYSLRMDEATRRVSAMLLNAENEEAFVISQNASGMDWTGAARGTLVREACEQTDAQLAVLPNGKLLMVWVGYTGVESNPVALYSAVYDGGAWSEPELVCDDGTPDIYPSLLASADGANLLWVSAKEAFSAGMQPMTQNEIEEFASNLLELRVKHYDADSGWEEQTAVIETGEIPYRPALAVHDNEIAAVWLNDSGIAWRILDADDGTTLGSGNLDAPQGELTGVAVGYGNSGFVASAAAICDDTAMAYHANLTRGVWYEGTSVTSVDAVCGAEDGTRFFVSDGCLLAGKNSQITRILRSDYFELSASGISCSQTSDGYALVWSSRMEDGYALCACVLSNTLEVIREPFVIEESDNVLYSMADAVYVNGSLSVSYCKLDYSQDSIVDTLEFLRLGSSVDLALKESGVYSSNFLTPGAKITTYVQAEDRGLASSGGIRAEIRDGDTLICAKEAENSLNLTLQWTVPEDYGGSRYQLTVLPLKDTDANADNNSISLDNVICCASVDSVLYEGRMNGNVLISAVVTNNGISETGELSLQVKSLSHDKVLYEQEIESVAFDSGVSVNIALKESDVEQEMLAFLLTSPNPAVECRNNYLSLLAAESEPKNVSSTTFSVTLHPNGGVISEELTSYIAGTETALPTNVTRSHYTFGGWYETEDFTGEAITEISTTDTGDKTFYAKWILATDVAPGDIDGDGVVGMKDLSVLRRYLNGWDVAVITEAMDVDADGSVSMKDFSLLRRYLNGWPVTLGQEDAGLSGVTEDSNAGEIEVGRVSAKAGETVTIPLTFKSNPGIVAYRLYVSYDETALELLESKTGDMTSVSFGPLENPFNILWDESLGGDVTGNAVIAELTFRVKEDASGYSPVSVTYAPDDIYNSDLVNVPFQVSNGGVEILSATGIAGKQNETSSHSVTVSGGSGSGEYVAGDSVTIHADPPPEGKVFDRWTGANGIQFLNGSQNSANAVFRMPDGDVALNATFRDQKSQGCYVATAVYGSYDCPEVWTLRRFRDNVLAKTWYGRLFIRLYYAVSPTAVRLFGDAQWFRDFWRERLDRMVTELQSEGFESTPYMDRDWN